ncbi:Protein of unknown function [Gryllus bimaculatus]|nr:Protein of unknown function [Gryllus bimaculatus]
MTKSDHLLKTTLNYSGSSTIEAECVQTTVQCPLDQHKSTQTAWEAQQSPQRSAAELGGGDRDDGWPYRSQLAGKLSGGGRVTLHLRKKSSLGTTPARAQSSHTVSAAGRHGCASNSPPPQREHSQQGLRKEWCGE